MVLGPHHTFRWAINNLSLGFLSHFPLRLTIDSGAETNLIQSSVVRALCAEVVASSQTALQADGSTPLRVCGETTLTLSRDKLELTLRALVVDDIDVEVLAGVPFMSTNDISVRPSKQHVILGDKNICNYALTPKESGALNVRRTQAYVLRAPPLQTTAWPGEFLELTVPDEISDLCALEPCMDTPSSRHHPHQLWPQPDIIRRVGNKIRIPNNSNEPRVLNGNEHFCQVLEVMDHGANSHCEITQSPRCNQSILNKSASSGHHELIKVNPDKLLSADCASRFDKLHAKLTGVFDPSIPGYNGAAGSFQAHVHMGPVQPPQRKGRVPQYSMNKLVELQDKFDDLQSQGVFKRPEDAGVHVEYVNPSFHFSSINLLVVTDW